MTMLRKAWPICSPWAYRLVAAWASARSCSRKCSNRFLLLCMPVSATPIATLKSRNTIPMLKMIFDFSFMFAKPS